MLTLPFFDPAHRDVAARFAAFAREAVEPFAAAAEDGDPIAAGRGFIDRAAEAGLLSYFVGDGRTGRNCARCVWRARRSPPAPGVPIRCSPFRDWAAILSSWPAAIG
jgi:hypothetical protein